MGEQHYRPVGRGGSGEDFVDEPRRVGFVATSEPSDRRLREFQERILVGSPVFHATSPAVDLWRVGAGPYRYGPLHAVPCVACCISADHPDRHVVDRVWESDPAHSSCERRQAGRKLAPEVGPCPRSSKREVVRLVLVVWRRRDKELREPADITEAES